MSSECIISLVQDGELSRGYHQHYYQELLRLEEALKLMPEWVMQFLVDDTTPNLDVDDESGANAAYIPAEDGFPASVWISSPDLVHLHKRQWLEELILEEFSYILDKLPQLAFTFQFPLD